MSDWGRTVLELELGGLNLAGVSGPAQPRDRLIVTEIDQWWSPAESKTQQVADDPLGHGGWLPASQRLAAKTMTVRGWVMASRLRLGFWREQLAGLQGAAGVVMRVHTELGASERLVRVVRVDMPDDRGRRHVRFAVDVIAPDPRRYSAGEQVSALSAPVVVRNSGTAPMSPTITVTQVVGAPSVTVTEVETGRQVIFTKRGPTGAPVNLAAGDVLMLDPGEGVAFLNGALTLGVSRSEWPEVPPGSARTYQLSRSGQLTAVQRSAWW